MSKFEQRTTCDYINFVEATQKGKELMSNKKTEIMGFYIIFSINVGLRVSDIKKLTFAELREGTWKFFEQKTKKYIEVPFNENITRAMRELQIESKEVFVFISQKNTVISTQHLNVKLKEIFNHLLPTHCISSHSLRKTFGRRFYEMNGRDEDALNDLSEIFNHSSIKTTRGYLGIRRQELNKMYFNL